jgi:transposase-like protein
VKSYEFGNGTARGQSSTVAVTIPVVCPACQSPSITTTARNPDENTYWRCGGCGEVWNASRRDAGASRAETWR